MDKSIRVEKFLIADGNPTLLAWDCSSAQKEILIKDSLDSVDQIGFVSGKLLQMMGNELCINASLAFASTFGKKGFVNISPLKSPIKYINISQYSSVKLPLEYKKIENIVLLNGIGFKFESPKYLVKKSELKNLANKYNLPAFGIILFEANRIIPFVYVVRTDSLKQESACGSGSIAASIFTGFKNIIQPTGKVIRVTTEKDFITVTSEVKEIING